MAQAAAAVAAAAAIRAKLAAAGKLSEGSAAPPPAAPVAAVAPPPPPVVSPLAAPEAPPQTFSHEIPINDISTTARTIVTRGPKQEEVSIVDVLASVVACCVLVSTWVRCPFLCSCVVSRQHVCVCFVSAARFSSCVWFSLARRCVRRCKPPLVSPSPPVGGTTHPALRPHVQTVVQTNRCIFSLRPRRNKSATKR